MHLSSGCNWDSIHRIISFDRPGTKIWFYKFKLWRYRRGGFSERKWKPASCWKLLRWLSTISCWVSPNIHKRSLSNQEFDQVNRQIPFKDLLRSWKGWFNEWNFYLTGLIYMCSRLIVNLSQVYMPFYLTDALKEP